jgi:hypothetical protein
LFLCVHVPGVIIGHGSCAIGANQTSQTQAHTQLTK